MRPFQGLPTPLTHRHGTTLITRPHLRQASNWRLLWVWIGLLALMVARAGTIWVTISKAERPFGWMRDPAALGGDSSSWDQGGGPTGLRVALKLS